MAMKKKDWQAKAKELGLSFQKDDSIATLASIIALELKLPVDSTDKSVAKKVEAALSSGAYSTVKLKVEEIVYDDKKKRPDVCLKINGENHWFPRKQISYTKTSVTMPVWLRDLKLGATE